MENFKPQKFVPSDLNGGFRYENGDIVDAYAINTPIEASYYAQETAERANEKAQSALDYVFSEGGINPLAVYPIGSIYLSISKTSPAEIFGGEWEQITNRFLLAASEFDSNSPQYQLGAEGGSADAIVVKHKHGMLSKYGVGTGSYESSFPWTASGGTATGVNTTEVGEDGTGKNMPPYIVVAVWKRTA
jgi:hypothetical protein